MGNAASLGLRVILGCGVALSLTACAVRNDKAPAVQVDPQAAVQALVTGLGPQHTCQVDQDCAGGGQSGACVLSTCFGLLSADNRTARRTLVERLARAPAAVQTAALPILVKYLDNDLRAPGERLAAIEGAGALLRTAVSPSSQRAALVDTLRKVAVSDDPYLAAAARVELATAGDGSSLPALLEDLVAGTELLRAEAARGMAGLQPTPHADTAKRALVGALADPSPVVQLAALHALRTWCRDGEVRSALTALPGRGAPHLTYAVDRFLTE